MSRTNYRTDQDAVHDRIRQRVKIRAAAEAPGRRSTRRGRVPGQMWLIFFWGARGWLFFGATYTKRRAKALRREAPLLAHLADVEVLIEPFQRGVLVR